tara:strand:- start:31261 stop:32328 length:1068 start_codon:yes stop_codon:yes gene_type:complete
MLKKEIIVTVGPSSINKNILEGLLKAGADVFRINLSHSDNENLKNYLKIFHELGITPSIDTQGPQLRVKNTLFKKKLKMNEKIIISFEDGQNKYKDMSYIWLDHPEVVSQIEIKDVLKVDFNGLAIEISEKIDKNTFSGNIIAIGNVLNNRAVDIKNKKLDLDVLTEFDKFAIDYAYKNGCKNYFCSFVSSSEDIRLIRKVLPPDAKLISKVETSKSLNNIEDILFYSDAVLIDRGDLSREISIPLIPIAVEKILKISKKYNKDIYVATNILDSMMEAKVPSRAEISDLYSLLSMGAKGIVLAAEVAIGNNPVESVSLVRYMMKIYEQYSNGLLGVGECVKPDSKLIGEELYQWL